MAKRYAAGLKGIPGIITPKTLPGSTNVFWMYSIRVSSEYGMTKDQLRAKLLEHNVDTRDFFYAPTDQPVLKPYLNQNDRFPVTEELANTGFYVPSGLAITDEQIDRVIEIIRDRQ